jgi:hypothetical protein
VTLSVCATAVVLCHSTEGLSHQRQDETKDPSAKLRPVILLQHQQQQTAAETTRQEQQQQKQHHYHHHIIIRRFHT